MKKFVSLMFCLLCVGMIFVGCSKEGKTYFYDVYDLWQEKIDATEDKEFYDKDSDITFEGSNINNLILTEFSEIKRYQEIFENIKCDVQLLSREFVHDPKLEGNALKTAQKKVTNYKEQLKEYAAEIGDFKTAKKHFETTCENLDFEVAGIIERDEYKTFLSKFRELTKSINNVFSKMYDCADSMFYSGKVSGFSSNKERIAAVKENYFATKVIFARDYIYFCYDNANTIALSDKEKIYDNYNLVRSLTLTEQGLNKDQSDVALSMIDGLIERISCWIAFYGAERNVVESAIKNGKFKNDTSGLEENLENAIIRQNYEKYRNLIDSTMKNLSETCVSLVAFY